VINIEIPLIIELVHELCCWLSGGARTVLPINSTAPRPLSLRASLASSNVQKPKLRSFVGSPAPSQCRLCVRSRSARKKKENAVWKRELRFEIGRNTPRKHSYCCYACRERGKKIIMGTWGRGKVREGKGEGGRGRGTLWRSRSFHPSRGENRSLPQTAGKML
jgi:hypothetical protein